MLGYWLSKGALLSGEKRGSSSSSSWGSVPIVPRRTGLG